MFVSSAAVQACEGLINGNTKGTKLSLVPKKEDLMFQSMSDLRKKNKEIGHVFFKHDTMKFWGSKIETTLLRGVFFITSEKGFSEKAPRTFTIRQARPTGEIVTVGKGREYKSLNEAKDAVKALLRTLKIKNVKRATTPRKNAKKSKAA